MVACDNDSCLIEWFPFECFGITQKPREIGFVVMTVKLNQRKDKVILL